MGLSHGHWRQEVYASTVNRSMNVVGILWVTAARAAHKALEFARRQCIVLSSWEHQVQVVQQHLECEEQQPEWILLCCCQRYHDGNCHLRDTGFGSRCLSSLTVFPNVSIIKAQKTSVCVFGQELRAALNLPSINFGAVEASLAVSQRASMIFLQGSSVWFGMSPFSQSSKVKKKWVQLQTSSWIAPIDEVIPGAGLSVGRVRISSSILTMGPGDSVVMPSKNR